MKSNKFPKGLVCILKHTKDKVIITGRLGGFDRDVIIRFLDTNLVDVCRDSDLIPNSKFFRKLYGIEK